MAAAKTFKGAFWRKLPAKILAYVSDPSGDYAKAAQVSGVTYTAYQEEAEAGQTSTGSLTPTWYDPPRGTPGQLDARWQNRLYGENRAGFNFECDIPAEAFPRSSHTRIEILVTFTTGEIAPIVIEGPANTLNADPT